MVNPTQQDILLAQRGDRLAFKRIVELCQPYVYALSCRFIIDRFEAEDITQEAFVKLWRHLPNHQSDVKISTWLYKVVTNLCFDYLKSTRHKAARQTHDAETLHIAGENQEDALHQREFHAMVLKAAETLKPKQRAIFILRDIEGVEMEEIATIMEMSAGNVKSNLYYARTNMQVLVKGWMKEDLKP